MEPLRSACLFIWGIIKRWYFWAPTFTFYILQIFKLLELTIKMNIIIGLSLIIVIILLGGIGAFHEVRMKLVKLKNLRLHTTIRGLSMYDTPKYHEPSFIWHFYIQISNESPEMKIGSKNIWLEKYRDGELFERLKPIGAQKYAYLLKEGIVDEANLIAEDSYFEPGRTIQGELYFLEIAEYSSLDDFTSDKYQVRIAIEDSTSRIHRSNEWKLSNYERVQTKEKRET